MTCIMYFFSALEKDRQHFCWNQVHCPPTRPWHFRTRQVPFVKGVCWVSGHPPLQAGSHHPALANSCLPGMGPQFPKSSDYLRETWNLEFFFFMWNVPIFKKLARLFLKTLCRPTKHVCGLPVCYFCLKATSLFSVSLYLSFINSLPGKAMESFLAIGFGTLEICGMSLTFGALLWPPLAGVLASVPAWDSPMALFSLHP